MDDSGAASPASAEVRASDDERHRTAELLGEHAATGRITLGELEDRVGRAYSARTHAELAALTVDLPAPSQPEPERERKASRWFIAVMGGSHRRNGWRLSGQMNVVAIMGGDDIDLRQAEIEGEELTINLFCLMGGPNIYLPDTVEVEVVGPAIMGGNDERGSTRAARPGAPVIRIQSFALMGGADIWRLPAETRGMSLRRARRAAKALERGRSIDDAIPSSQRLIRHRIPAPLADPLPASAIRAARTAGPSTVAVAAGGPAHATPFHVKLNRAGGMAPLVSRETCDAGVSPTSARNPGASGGPSVIQRFPPGLAARAVQRAITHSRTGPRVPPR